MKHKNADIIQQELVKFKLLDHSFYKVLWNEGLLSREDLRYYAEQYYFIEENFLSRLKQALDLGSSCKDFLKITNENIKDEIGSGNPKRSHLNLWSKFAVFCGSKKSDLCLNAQNKSVKNLIEETSNLVKQSIPSAIGVFYAYEWQIPEISESKIKGLVKYYGAKLASEELGFFEEHKVADIWHTKQWNKLINNFNENEFKTFQKSSVETAKLLLCFLDSVMKERKLTC